MSTSRDAAPGLRERKKQKVRLAIRQEAYRLFAQQGYQATTVDQIAEAADVSPSTFFRYYRTKEQLILSDDYDPVLAEALARRPKGEPIVAAIRAALAESLLEVLAADREELLSRIRLTFDDPDIRAHAMEEQLRNQDEVARVLGLHLDRPAEDLDIRCAAAMIIAISMTVMRTWVASGGSADLGALYEKQLGLLENGLPF
ncbi:TetR family transcriptional regulator [Aeromicrobium sp. Root236]|uniref:acyl-CoA-like ligand-binding transcription factor n=1 Tax=Aeromicrobium sp. Root236 TaxID=1736498 RepID=UPI0006F56642|nr:TetR family transcriptional regulator [Aeromicrobium sp. Root236]KRC66846.1 TetR family transcriptional regulator [Aeromicrobium sp. Root236]